MVSKRRRVTSHKQTQPKYWTPVPFWDTLTPTFRGKLTIMAAQKGASGVRDPVNFVHKNAILEETIKKELLNSKLYTEFMTNPFNPSK